MKLTPPPPDIEILLLCLVAGAAVYDIRYRRIPNWLTLSGTLAGIGLNSFLRHGWSGVAFSLLGLALGFSVYFLLYLLRAMGAGDVKLMGAVGSLLGWQNWFGVFVITAILGGVMALIVAAGKKRLHKTIWNVAYILDEMKHGRPAYLSRQELDVKNPNAVGLPHGAVIAVGCLFFLALSARMG